AASQARQYRRLLVDMISWNQDRDRLADDLLGRVAEHPLRRRIPGHDDAVERLGDDGIVRRLDYGGQAAAELIRPFTIGDVLDDSQELIRTALLSEERRCRVAPEHAPILAQIAFLEHVFPDDIIDQGAHLCPRDLVILGVSNVDERTLAKLW